MPLGLLGVVGFSFSLPATRLAVTGLDPWFVAFGRAFGAGVLAAGYLVVSMRPGGGRGGPDGHQLRRLGVVAVGVVVGFPLCTSLALTEQTAAHGAVVVALMPAVTTVFAVLRGDERPSRRFWVAATASFIAVTAFVASSGGFRGGPHGADLWLLAGVVLCALGYTEGGMLARDLGGARTICWALVLSLPVTVTVTALTVGRGVGPGGFGPWLGFGYVTVISMFLGFFAWYAGLARGGVARVGQVQALQPVLTLAWSALVLSEPVSPTTVLAAFLVVGCVVMTQRTR